MSLDISPLINAIARLSEGLQRYQQDISDIQIRDGLVQRFEFTYEISHKMLKRYLEQSSASPDQFDAMPFADLIRTANEQGLLKGDWPAWRGVAKPATPMMKISPSRWSPVYRPFLLRRSFWLHN